MSVSQLSQHRRGRSTGSMTNKDEDLALFHQMKAHERNNFLHPSTDDIETSLRYRIVAPSSPLGPTKANDLLGLEPDKSDYDWLLTPPQTPLFPSLEDAPKQQFELAASIRPSSRTRPSRAARGSGSPSPRTASPSSSTGSLNRRASFGNSSPARSASSRPVTPTSSRPLTPGRTTPPSRRSQTSPSPNVSTTSSTNRNTYMTNNSGAARRPTARSNSPSSKPRPSFVHPAMTADYGEAPPNLRTSLSDRPVHATRGASVSPRLDTGGAPRRAVSPSLSRSYSSSSSKSPIHSSVHRPELSGKRPMSGHEETSPVKPVTKKPVRLMGSNSFSGTSSQKRSFDTTPGSVRQMDFRRNSSSGFRPLMSNSHITSFYNRASSSLQHHRPAPLSITDSSMNSSASATSVRESDHEADEVSSKHVLNESAEMVMDDVSAAFNWRPVPREVGLMQSVDKTDEMVGTPTSSDAFYSTDFQEEEDMDIDECQPSPALKQEDAEYVRGLLDSLVNAAVEFAERSHKVSSVGGGVQPCKAQQPDPGEAVEELLEQLSDSFPVEHVLFKLHDDDRRSFEEATAKQVDSYVRPVQTEAASCFSQLIDPKYSSSSLEVYQFDQELHSTVSEVQDSPSTSRSRDQVNDLIPEKRLSSSSTPGSMLASAPTSTSATMLASTPGSTQASIPAPTCTPASLPAPTCTPASVPAPTCAPASTPASTPGSAPASMPASASASSSALETTTSTSLGGHHKAEVHVARASSRSSKPSLRDPPSFTKQFSAHISRKRESRESSLFSIQINSSKGESISSGRPASTDDTQSSIDTPRRFHDCNGENASSYSSYKAYDEYDTKSEESCVDYYIDSMEARKYVEVEKAVSREHIERLPSLTRRSSSSPGLPKDLRHHSFDTDEDGFVDYYIDDFSSRHGKAIKDVSGTEFLEAEKGFVNEKKPEESNMEAEPPVPEQGAVFMEEDDTHIEVCSMDSDAGEMPTEAAHAPRPAAAQYEETDTMAECWKQLGEMDCESEEHKQSETGASGSLAGGAEMIKSVSETREAILICSSIVHDIAYKAASLGMEKEDLKALASTEELVTFISRQMGASSAADEQTATRRWRSEESTVRRTVAYLQNQKTSQSTTVGFMQQNPVEEDVKDHIIPEHHFIDPSADASQEMKKRKTKASRCTGCKCTIM